MSLDVIKEYLVALGFEVDMPEYDKAKGAINQLGRVVQSETAGMAKNFTGAATAITGAIAGVAAATAGLVRHVTNADMEYQKLALRMWTTRQQAKELKTTLDAMGEDIVDVAWIPELRQQYEELRRQGQMMQTPADAAEQLQYIRSIGFEFKRMKLEATYAMEWITYNVVKMLAGPIKGIKDGLKSFNDMIIEKMPEWSAKVATFLTNVINLGRAGARFISDIATGLYRIFDALPRGVKIFVATLMAAGALIMSGPIGWFIAGLGTVLILLEDFFGYLDGRESSKTLAPMWKYLVDLWGKFDGLLTEARDFLRDVYKVAVELYNFLVESGAMQAIIDLFHELGITANNIFLGMVNVTKEVLKFFRIAGGNAGVKTFWTWFKNELSATYKLIAAIGKAVLGVLDAIGLAMQGKFKEAGERARRILPDLVTDIGDAFATKFDGKSKVTGTATERLRKAIGLVESSGRADTPPNFAGASGKYQFTQGTWDGVARMAGRRDLVGVAPYQASEADQDQLAQFYVNQLYSKYNGRADLVAAAWYGGEGYADSMARGNPSFDPNAPQEGDMPSVNDHIAKVLREMGDSSSAVAAPQASAYNTSSNTKIEVGDIIITEPGANAQEIKAAVADGIVEGRTRVVARQQRDLQGVYG